MPTTFLSAPEIRIDLNTTYERGRRNLVRDVYDSFGLLFFALSHPRSWWAWPIRNLIYKEVYFTCVAPLASCVFLATCVHVLFTATLCQVGGAGIIGQKLIELLIVQVDPILCASVTMITGGAALASELVTMKHRGEIRSLRLMGIDVERYLIIPRILGKAIGMMFLVFYVQVFATLLSTMATDLMFPGLWSEAMGANVSAITPANVASMVARNFIFGGIIGAFACVKASWAGSSANEIPRVVVRTIREGLIVLFSMQIVFSIVGI